MNPDAMEILSCLRDGAPWTARQLAERIHGVARSGSSERTRITVSLRVLRELGLVRRERPTAPTSGVFMAGDIFYFGDLAESFLRLHAERSARSPCTPAPRPLTNVSGEH